MSDLTTPMKVIANLSHRQLDSDYFKGKRFDILHYLQVEMFGLGEPGELDPPQGTRNIHNFFIVPFALEQLIVLGCFICFDAFLYVFTYLPIRVLFSGWLLFNEAWKYLFSASIMRSLQSLVMIPSRSKGRKEQQSVLLSFHRTHIYDLMRGAMILTGCVVLMQINMSRVYHYIRGQSMIKLYVLTSMMEVMDKLLSSFGLDVFDALHSQTKRDPWSFKLLLYFLVVNIYVVIHSGLYFLHVATLTVVINSADETLITVLILNNFAEMKSFVFKKFDSKNLFQLTCSDITERFQTTLFLGIILIVALAQAGSSSYMEVLYSFARMAFCMITAEMLVDSMKHAFINKFNSLSAEVYKDFGYVLRGDILNNQKDKIILDHTYTVTRRVGLAQIPLGCVCIRYMMLAISAPPVQSYFAHLNSSFLCYHFLALFIALVLIKIALGVGLIYYATSEKVHDIELLLSSPAPVLIEKTTSTLTHHSTHSSMATLLSTTHTTTAESVVSHDSQHSINVNNIENKPHKGKKLPSQPPSPAGERIGTKNNSKPPLHCSQQSTSVHINNEPVLSESVFGDHLAVQDTDYNTPEQQNSDNETEIENESPTTTSEKLFILQHQERIVAMDELGDIERYTVYKGGLI